MLCYISLLVEFILKGLSFLDTIYDIWTEKQWNNPSFDTEMVKWIKLLLGAVDITSEKTVSYLKEFISLSHPVCIKYEKEIVDQVCIAYICEINLFLLQIISEVGKNSKRLTILKFSRMFKSFNIWPSQVHNI